jgi:hypothetical protein
MTTKKKTTKKQAKSKRTAGKKVTSMKKAVEKKLAKRMVAPKKKLARKKAAPIRAAVKTKGGRKTTGGKTASALQRQVRGRSQSVDTVPFAPEKPGARAGEQAGDLQGLSNVQGADSESVDELLEEGNAFEADVVKGVEDAGEADGKEVRAHEVPEDDVPDKYLDIEE